MKNRQAKFKSRYRLQVILAAGFALVAQTSTTMHAMFVQHTRCIEHGEWVDADQGHAHADADSISRFTATKAVESREHEHCETAALQGRRLQPASFNMATQPAPLVIAVEHAFVESAFTSAARRLSIAPKTSPPTV